MTRLLPLLLICFRGTDSSALDYVIPEEEYKDSSSEVVPFPQGNSTSVRFQYDFEAFGKQFNLRFEKNDKLVAPGAQFVSRTDKDELEQIDGVRGNDCHFIHRDEHAVASMSVCGDSISGFITGSDGTSFEILPNTHKVHKRMMNTWTTDNDDDDNKNSRKAKSLVIKRAYLPEDLELPEPVEFMEKRSNISVPEKKSGTRKTIETAVFFDAAAYQKFSPHFGGSKSKLIDFILSYMNGIHALYHHESLGNRKMDISVVRLEILERQPSDLPAYGGERNKLLKSFCQYQSNLNQGHANGEAGHWDMALYVSALDFYANEGGKNSYVTMGLAAVDGVCSSNYNCVIGELGVTNSRGKPYPSAGFTSVFVMAHEIGHNLGLHHDGKSGDNNCDTNGFIMSSSRGTKGENVWSQCSVSKLQSKPLPCLDNTPPTTAHTIGQSLPGIGWGVNKQCQMFLLDQEATADHTDSTMSDVCYALRCRTPSRIGYYRAGPALEGTFCGSGKWCKEGQCVTSGSTQPSSGSWTEWSEGTCSSKCIQKSKGGRMRQRTCSSSDGNCPGKSKVYDLCDDSSQCGGSRTSIAEYASERCGIFSRYVSGVEAQGAQAGYSAKKPTQACNIYCRRNVDGKSRWYTPKYDLNDIPSLDAYFPDGTFCHADETGVQYYCLRGTCLQEGARVGKSATSDINANQNGLPEDEEKERTVPQDVMDYFSLDDDMNPMGGSLTDSSLDRSEDTDEWNEHDEYEIP